MADVRRHLALVYHRYLTGEPGIKKLSMDINNEPVIPFDPFLLKKSYQAKTHFNLEAAGRHF